MDIKNFAIIKGKGVQENNGAFTLIFTPEENNHNSDQKNKLAENFAFAEIRSDLLFSNGEIEFKFKRTNLDSGILVCLPLSNEENITIGMSYYTKSFVINNNYKHDIPICEAGNSRFYEVNKEHAFKIVALGSNIKLYINKVLLCEANLSIKESPLMLRMVTEGTLEVYDIKAKIIKPKVFVIMQFTKEYNELYEDVIRPIVEIRGYECIRADEFYTSTPILKDIIDSIKQSNIVIAEITPDNPNVFYEIGYSHAIEKPTILLCDRKREKLPFDVSSFRTLFYENTIAGKKKVEENLKKYLDSLV